MQIKPFLNALCRCFYFYYPGPEVVVLLKGDLTGVWGLKRKLFSGSVSSERRSSGASTFHVPTVRAVFVGRRRASGGTFFPRRCAWIYRVPRSERVRLDVLKKRGGSRFYALEVGSASSLSPGQLLNSRACLRRAQEVQEEEVVGRLTKGI